MSEGAAFISGATLAIDGAAPLGNAVVETGKYKAAPEYQGFHRAVRPAILNEGEEQ